MITLEMTEEEYSKLKPEDHVLVLEYVTNDGETTRAWVQAFGTKEDCEEEQEQLRFRFFIVPENIHIESSIVEARGIAPPDQEGAQ
jgi:hypothetical protein